MTIGSTSDSEENTQLENDHVLLTSREQLDEEEKKKKYEDAIKKLQLSMRNEVTSKRTTFFAAFFSDFEKSSVYDIILSQKGRGSKQ